MNSMPNIPSVTTLEITSNQFSDFIVDYYKKLKEYPTYRLGQHFCNTFNLQNNDLFYMPERTEALQYIIEHYVRTS
jgi:hypothetical protein